MILMIVVLHVVVAIMPYRLVLQTGINLCVENQCTFPINNGYFLNYGTDSDTINPLSRSARRSKNLSSYNSHMILCGEGYGLSNSDVFPSIACSTPQ